MSTREPYLLTPGPLTTSAATKKAMLRDWGSRDEAFIGINARIRQRLVTIAGGEGSHVCVPLQGSGTFIVEATLGTLLKRSDQALVLINGAYGRRMAKILDYLGRAYITMETPEDAPPDPADIDKVLAAAPSISHVLAVHCETTSGILNPIGEIAATAAGRNRSLIIDAMSSFGGIPFDIRQVPCAAVVASSNKCLEGAPGFGFAVIRETTLAACRGNAHSLSLDLYDQWTAMEATGQWRFTPPTHVIAAFDAALQQFEAEGGVSGRNARYANNCRILVQGMRAMGFKTLLADDLQAPIIVTFHTPADPKFDFAAFYGSLNKSGYVIYPGKLTKADSFRIGCIGHLGEVQINGALRAVAKIIKAMGVKNTGPS